MVEAAERILPVEDHGISRARAAGLERQGMHIRTLTTVLGLERGDDGVAAVLRGAGGESTIRVERVISAVGITANTEGLGLEGTRVELRQGHVVVDDWLQTGEPGIYAIGDLAAAPWLAHKASHEGVICVERLAGLPHVVPLDALRIPACLRPAGRVVSVGHAA